MFLSPLGERLGEGGSTRRLPPSDAEADIVKSFQLQANCYLNKPVKRDAFGDLVKNINVFWLTKAQLPLPPA